MLNPLFRSPERLVSEWPEVFEDLYISTLPVNYINLIKLEFINGRLWEIDLTGIDLRNINSIETIIVESIRDVKDEILKLEFEIDVLKLKKDITTQCKRFL